MTTSYFSVSSVVKSLAKSLPFFTPSFVGADTSTGGAPEPKSDNTETTGTVLIVGGVIGFFLALYLLIKCCEKSQKDRKTNQVLPEASVLSKAQKLERSILTEGDEDEKTKEHSRAKRATVLPPGLSRISEADEESSRTSPIKPNLS